MTPAEFLPGRRVRLTADLEPFIFGEIRAGETGVITTVEGGWGVNTVSALVRLDRHFPDLDEWDNEIQVGTTDESATTPDCFELCEGQ